MFHRNATFKEKISTSLNLYLQAVYLPLQLRTVGMESVADGADVVRAKRCNVAKELWAYKIHHAPVLLQAVLEWVTRQDNPCGTLELLCGHREFRLSSK